MRLLVSVKNATEAVAAIRGGADIIDIKNPAHGPLGMADPITIQKIIETVGDHAPVSAALGELFDEPVVNTLPRKLTFAKAGLSLNAADKREWSKPLTKLFEQIRPIRPVAVFYADLPVFEHHGSGRVMLRCPCFENVLQWAEKNQAAGLLIDTFHKNGSGLFEMELPLVEMVRRTQAVGLFIALAGQLSGDSLKRAMALQPDIIAVRSAVCEGDDRQATVTENRVGMLSQLIAKQNASPVASAR